MPSYRFWMEMQLAAVGSDGLGRFDFFARSPHRSPKASGWVFLARVPVNLHFSPPKPAAAVSHFNLHSKRGRSTASRSGRVMLSRPSSLQGRSDFPTPVTPWGSKVSSILPLRLPWLGIPWRRRDLRSNFPHSFSACHRPYSGSLAGALALCFPASIGLLPIVRGSTRILSVTGLSRNRTLPVTTVRPLITKLHRSLYAAARGFGRRP